MSLVNDVDVTMYKSFIPFLSLFVGVFLLATLSVLPGARPVAVIDQLNGVYAHGCTHSLSNIDALPFVFNVLSRENGVLWCELIPIINIGVYQSYTTNSHSNWNCFKTIRVSYDTKHIFDKFSLLYENNRIEI